MKHNRTKLLLVGIVLLAVLVFAAACSSGDRVASVNGTNLYERDIAFLLASAENELSMEYFTLHGTTTFDHNSTLRDGLTFGRVIREEAVRAAAISIIIADFAEEIGVALTDEDLQDLDAHMNAIRREYGERELQLEMHAQRIDGIDHFAEIIRTQMLVEAVIYAVIHDADLFAQFAHLMPQEPDQDQDTSHLLGAKHILASFTQFDWDEEAAEVFAQYILDRIHDGDDFVYLMNTYSQDPGLIDFPNGYTFAGGQMVPEFEQTTRELAVGEISGLVRTSHGIHIILRTEPVFADWMFLMGEPVPNEQDMMVEAVFVGLQEMIDNADIRFFSALDRVDIHP